MPRTDAVPHPELGADGRVLEGVVTTLNHDGTPHISPMGPIVDDRPENLLALDATLEPLGHRIVHAGSGEEALRQLLGLNDGARTVRQQHPRLLNPVLITAILFRATLFSCDPIALHATSAASY